MEILNNYNFLKFTSSKDEMISFTSSGSSSIFFLLIVFAASPFKSNDALLIKGIFIPILTFAVPFSVFDCDVVT